MTRRTGNGRRRRRAISTTIAATLMVGMTIVVGVILWTFRPPIPASPPSLAYVGIGQQSEPAWGDPTDCTNTTIYATCNNLPAVFVVITAHAPSNMLLRDLYFEFRCNGTSLVNGSFQSMEVVPGSGANPGASSPKLGACGTWTPSSFGHTATYFNRLAYFQQARPGAPTLNDADQFVPYVHPAAAFCDKSNHCPDDDYHGAPPWCFTVPTACQILVTFGTNPSSLVATIPISQLAVV